MSTKGRKWSKTQRTHFVATMAKKRALREQLENGSYRLDPPETIFILVNGKLERFELRTVNAYVPSGVVEKAP
jgi:hypothetical protein